MRLAARALATSGLVTPKLTGTLPTLLSDPDLKFLQLAAADAQGAGLNALVPSLPVDRAVMGFAVRCAAGALLHSSTGTCQRL